MKRFTSLATASLLSLSLLARPAAATGFSDVSEDDWHANYVKFALDMGMMSGTEGEFRPNDPATRGNVAEAHFGIYHSTLKAGSDAKMSAVDFVSFTNIMRGYSATFFGVTAPITREEFAVSLRGLCQALEEIHGKSYYKEPNNLDFNQFEDSSHISAWAKSDVAWAVENGFMLGYKGELNPRGEVTRAEVATMLKGFYDTFQLSQL